LRFSVSNFPESSASITIFSARSEPNDLRMVTLVRASLSLRFQSYYELRNTYREGADSLSQPIRSESHYQDQTFEGVRLERLEISSSTFHECTFLQCTFSETSFRNCRFVYTTFKGCDLSLLQVPGSSFTSTQFQNSKLVGVNWTMAAWPKADLGPPITFKDCALSHSTFIGLSLKGIQIQNSVAKEVDFREADLAGADFSGTDLESSLFGKTDLTEADFRSARNYLMDPSQNKLQGAKFSLPEAIALLHGLEIELEE
jgi:fluoroquinolone resistance protein